MKLGEVEFMEEVRDILTLAEPGTEVVFLFSEALSGRRLLRRLQSLFPGEIEFEWVRGSTYHINKSVKARFVLIREEVGNSWNYYVLMQSEQSKIYVNRPEGSLITEGQNYNFSFKEHDRRIGK